MRTKIYTAYTHLEKTDPAERTVLVREGFSVWAFLLHVLWLLANRLWLAAVVFVLLLVTLDYVGRVYHLSHVSIWTLQFLMQLILGFMAHDLQRTKLQRRGFRFAGIVAAESELMAERRYHDIVAIQP